MTLDDGERRRLREIERHLAAADRPFAARFAREAERLVPRDRPADVRRLLVRAMLGAGAVTVVCFVAGFAVVAAVAFVVALVAAGAYGVARV